MSSTGFKYSKLAQNPKDEDNPDRVFLKTSTSCQTTVQYLVFFLPGNPGVVAFYRDFLHHLHGILSSSNSQDAEFEILGISMPGFHLDEMSAPPVKLPANLDAQTAYAERVLADHIVARSDVSYKVILVGHSLGAWYSLQILQRWCNNLLTQTKGSTIPSGDIIAAIGLTPGILHLAKSPAAKELLWMASVPYAVAFFNVLIKGLLFPIPNSILARMLSWMNDYPSQHITTSITWLRSRWGVYTSLALAYEEMDRIASDEIWDDKVWGSANPVAQGLPAPAKLFFLYGKEDAWVREDLRDEFISRRGRQGSGKEETWKPVFEVDETGITHDFSIKFARVVAEKTAGWIEEVVRSDAQSRESGRRVRATK